MINLGVPSDGDLDLRVVKGIEELGGVANYRLLRFAASRDAFTTGEAARAIGEAQQLVDRRAEKLVGHFLLRVESPRPKRFAASPEARDKIRAIRAQIEAPPIATPPVRLVLLRPNSAISPAQTLRHLQGATDIFDADESVSTVAVFPDEPALVRDLLHRLHRAGIEADEVRLAARREG